MKIFDYSKRFCNLRMLALASLGFGLALPAIGQDFVAVTNSFPSLNSGSSAWGDIDNDGDMDLALSGTNTATSQPYTGIWVNNGGGSFTELPGTAFTPALTQMKSSSPNSMAWGDYDNDGDVDLLIVGSNGSNHYTKIWRNEGSNTFFNSFDFLPGQYNACAWVDADNDGDLDVFNLGESNLNGGSVLLLNGHNAGSTTFTTSPDSFPHFNAGDCAFGDYDNDGDLDLAIGGYLDGFGTGQTTQIWDNDGTGSYTLSTLNLTGLGYSDLDWVDVDADGDLDLMMVGFSGPTDTPEAMLLKNSGNASSRFDTAVVGLMPVGYANCDLGDLDGDGYPDLVIQGDTTGFQNAGSYVGTWNPSLGVFFPSSATFDALSQGSINLVDYDNDGDLDLFSVGLRSLAYTNLYENVDTSTTNAAPSAPSNLVGTAITNTSVEWTWDAATDDKTPSAGLTYRLIVEDQNNFDLLTPTWSNTNSQVMNVSEFGYASGTSWVTEGLVTGRQYCAVVIAVDGGKMASGWSSTGCASVIVGIDDQENAFTLNAWPTPATTYLNVSLNGLQGSGTLQIIGLDGRIMHSENFNQLDQKAIDVSGLAQGMYLLNVQVEGQAKPTTLRFTKQ